MDRNAEIIEECIAYNNAEFAAADAEDKHYWDGWTPELIRQGTPSVRVTVRGPGLGHTSIFVAFLSIELPNGKNTNVREPVVERIATRTAARRNGLEGHARRLAARLYGADLPVIFNHLV